MFDPNKKWTKEEITDLINKEAPIFSIANKYTLDDLLEENPDYKKMMLEDDKHSSAPELYKCADCGKTMPLPGKEMHLKYCKISENGKSIQTTSTTK